MCSQISYSDSDDFNGTHMLKHPLICTCVSLKADGDVDRPEVYNHPLITCVCQVVLKSNRILQARLVTPALTCTRTHTLPHSTHNRWWLVLGWVTTKEDYPHLRLAYISYIWRVIKFTHYNYNDNYTVKKNRKTRPRRCSTSRKPPATTHRSRSRTPARSRRPPGRASATSERRNRQ